MFGLMTPEVKTSILKRHGREAWRRVKAVSALTDAEFDVLQDFAGKDPQAVIGAVADRLGFTPSDVIVALGRFWIAYMRDTPAGLLLYLQGETFVERLRGINNVQQRLGRVLPHLRLPSLIFEEVADGVHRLHYRTHRRGYEYLVASFLHGLAEDVGAQVDVRFAEARTSGRDHDVFEIRVLDAAVGAACATPAQVKRTLPM